MKKLIVILSLFLSFPFAFTQEDDVMPAFILIRLVERGDIENPMNYLPGYAVGAFDRNQYGGKQILPKFGQIIVSDQTVAEINALYCKEWEREIDWEFVSHDMANDVHVLSVFTRRDLVSQSGLNGLTRDAVENFLNKWNATVQSIDANSVVFSAGVRDAIESFGFWKPIDISGAAFSEISYTQSTGVHSIRVNYANIPGATAAKVAAAITQRGCEVTGNQPAQKRMTFSCGRDTVFSAFKNDVKGRLKGSFARRKWRVTQAGIENIVNSGGTITVTRDQLLDLFHSRLSD